MKQGATDNRVTLKEAEYNRNYANRSDKRNYAAFKAELQVVFPFGC
jgi:hypothetical protein